MDAPVVAAKQSLRRRRGDFLVGEDDRFRNGAQEDHLPLQRSQWTTSTKRKTHNASCPPSSPLSRLDGIIIASLTVLAAISRFYGLSHPDA